MIERLLPAPVASAEAFDDSVRVALFPEEERVIAAAVGKRRREFTTARACARQALGQLGVPPAPVVPGVRGAPVWPAGIVGSITHCEGYRASAVARDRDMRTVGLDAEPNRPLPDGALDAIALPGERAEVRELSAAGGSVHWDRLLFCAKEAVYKAWFPLTHRWLDFGQAAITIQPTAGTFVARLLVQVPLLEGERLDAFAGRWLADDGLLLTAIALRERGAGTRQPAAMISEAMSSATLWCWSGRASPASPSVPPAAKLVESNVLTRSCRSSP